MKFDVVIVGAGVTGAMLARNSSRYHASVCLLEKENDVAMGASKANSGIVHGGYDPEPGTLKALLNTRGVELLYRAAKELNVPCIQNGSMVCAFSAAEEAHLEALLQRGAENNISGLSILSGDEARKMEPHLSQEVTKVLYVPNAGIISPYELTIAAVGNAMDNAIEAVEKIEEKEKRQIDVMIYRQHNFLVMNIINPLSEQLIYEDGLPLTKKADKFSHGFGLRSIRQILRKYEGFLNISEEDGCFSLKMLIPIQLKVTT
jgi:L-2-hydroxyglutarate oxidase LhgO